MTPHLLLGLADAEAKSLILYILACLAASLPVRPTLRRRVWILALGSTTAVTLLSVSFDPGPGWVELEVGSAPFSGGPATLFGLLVTAGPFVWLLGFVVACGYLAAGGFALRRLRLRSRVWSHPAFGSLVGGHPNVPELRLGGPHAFSAAVTWGWPRPTILLSSEATHWDDGRLRVVLLHELAHIQRADFLVQLIARSLGAFLWFNPFVWLAVRRLREAMEAAADEAVLEAGIRPSDYASVLLEMVAGAARASRKTGLAVSVAHRSALEDRIRAIVAFTPKSHRAEWFGRASTVAAAAAVAGLGLVRAFGQSLPPSTDRPHSAEWLAGYRAALAFRGGDPSDRPASRSPDGRAAIESNVRRFLER